MPLVLQNTAPVVLNKTSGRTDGVYVGRPSKFGNPFEIGKDGSRAEVIRKFEKYLNGNEALIAEVKAELKGKNLICWCAPKACHATVLLQIANS
jgi:hypothetical protein